jgi:hypothetical protein
LSTKKWGLSAAAWGDYALFGGGSTDYYNSFSASVDIYNIFSKTWTTSQLSQARNNPVATAANGIFLFATGMYSIGTSDYYLPTVDIYNIATGRWSIQQLSEAKAFCAASTVGNLIFIGGGANEQIVSNRIDV